jgi:DNA-directed RNA polymerase subunit RPC12/RpoP
MDNTNGNDELTLYDISKELQNIEDNRKRLRTEARILFRKEHPSAWFRLTHNYDLSKSHAFYWLTFYIAFATVAILIIGAYNGGMFSKVGDINHELETEREYYCPYCDWHGNVTEMESHDGQDSVYYYCPDCGHVMGKIPYPERQG